MVSAVDGHYRQVQGHESHADPDMTRRTTQELQIPSEVDHDK
jgi:hypothetical protein